MNRSWWCVLPYVLGCLPSRWQWAPHNLFAHPLSEVLYQCGLEALADRVHDLTIPNNPRDQRG